MYEINTDLPHIDFNRLISKIASYKNKLQEEFGGGCMLKGYQLLHENGGGYLWWIGNLSKLGLDYGIFHMYYIPHDAVDNQLALNQADNGYSQYPQLTVAEVKLLGEPQDKSIIKQLLKIKD